MLQHKLKLLTGIVLYFFLLAPVYAWQQTGHQLTALLALRGLEPTVREKWLTILKHHPRLQQDFISKMPTSIRRATDKEKETWLFLQASVWPDLVRHLPEKQKAIYHQANWHYINEPIFLSTDAETIWKQHTEKQNTDILKALNKAISILRSNISSPGEKAISLCWLLHLVGDLHMPLHTALLVTETVYPQGDAGGGGIPLMGGGRSWRNLHGFWDALPGEERELNDLNHKLDLWLAINPVDTTSPQVKTSSFKMWKNESHQLAVTFAYAPTILVAIEEAEKEKRPVKALLLSSEYRKKSIQLARQQTIIGGYRLGVLLNSVDPKGSQR